MWQDIDWVFNRIGIVCHEFCGEKQLISCQQCNLLNWLVYKIEVVCYSFVLTTS